ncbi:PA2169 family four-helix-bundle protein [Synoicihabitans lomoniglobus]|uniref:PA2169 family four-helix-bundle protein n=1 Tax=Synoicihabitans lomoniglobus TaxID=2909285 RepID=A0AAE9ZXG3_9BACT|nr:PA2169 family four-helix-bundle protein [Opitutaceae bacterium LMO-M01]WED64705.1 PA2169 family four-helix-bundle protein [Opitutaceae bacterium LMO-M01]
MNTTTEETIHVLNNLIEVCCDGADGFGHAAEEVELPELQAVFRRLSEQCRDFAAALRTSVNQLGEKAEDSGSIAAKAHRGWMKLREVVTTKDNHAILAECERGEDHAVAAYRDALSATLDPTAAALVQRQYAEVQQSHDKVRDLRDSEVYQNV